MHTWDSECSDGNIITKDFWSRVTDVSRGRYSELLLQSKYRRCRRTLIWGNTLNRMLYLEYLYFLDLKATASKWFWGCSVLWQGEWCLGLRPSVPPYLVSALCNFSKSVASRRYIHVYFDKLPTHNVVMMWWVLVVVSTYITTDKLWQTLDLCLRQWCYTQRLWGVPNRIKMPISTWSRLRQWRDAVTPLLVDPSGSLFQKYCVWWWMERDKQFFDQFELWNDLHIWHLSI